MNETPDPQSPPSEPQYPVQGDPPAAAPQAPPQPAWHPQQGQPVYGQPVTGQPGQGAPSPGPYPQQPGAPAGPYAPAGPPPARPRRGLPVGAWIGIGAGALLLVALLLIAAFLVIPGLLRFGAPSAAPPAPVAPQEEDELPPPADSAAVTLDDHLDYAAGPFWMTPFEEGWNIDTFDVEGYNRFSNPTSGCKMLTFQGQGDPAETSNSDRVASENLLDVALRIGIPWEATADPDVVPEGSIELLFDYAQPVEFAQYRASYPSAGGDRERRILIRSFTPGNNVLYAEVDCPSTEIDGTADQIFEGLGITEH